MSKVQGFTVTQQQEQFCNELENGKEYHDEQGPLTADDQERLNLRQEIQDREEYQIDDDDLDAIVDNLSSVIEMVDSRYVRTEYEYFSPMLNVLPNWAGYFQLTKCENNGFIVSGYVSEFNNQTMAKNLIRITGLKYYPKTGRTYADNVKCMQWGRWDGEFIKPSNWILKESEKQQEFYRSSKLVENHEYRDSGQVSAEFWAVVRFAIIEWRKSWKSK